MARRKQEAVPEDARRDREQLLERVQSLLARESDAGGDPELDLDYFTRAFLRRVPDEELLPHAPEQLAALIADQVAFLRRRPEGETLVRVFNPEPARDGWSCSHTVVQVINPDRPFIVDTLNLVMAELGLNVHWLVHPVIHVERDESGLATGLFSSRDGRGEPESVIHVQVDLQCDESALNRLSSRVTEAMTHIRQAVEDWPAMLQRVDEAIGELASWAPACEEELLAETLEFLSWIRDDHFIFLGVRDYVVDRDSENPSLDLVAGTGLGLLRESERTIRSRPLGTVVQGALLPEDPPLIITKTRTRSTVHRAGYMDYVGVVRFGDDGRVVAERRFIGLFTSNAYFRQVADTPLLRQKRRRVLADSGLRPGSHARKSLMHIIETLPRDDLFQATPAEIGRIALAILSLQERQRVRLLVRRERFNRFFSCLVFIPRDRFSTENRRRIQDILKRAYQGERLDYVLQISASRLARLQCIVRPKPGANPEPDVQALEQRIVEAVRSWDDGLREALVQRFGEDTGLRWAGEFGRLFPAAYQEDVSPWVASFDVEKLATLGDETDLKTSLYRPRKRESGILRFKLFKRGRPIPLSGVLPILENLGLRVMNERPYRLALDDEQQVWIQDYDMTYEREPGINLEQVREFFADGFEHAWRGAIQNDGLNQLILASRLHWRQVRVLRAYARYLLQTGIPFSLDYLSATLAAHPLLARLLIELFEALFDPQRDEETDYRRELAAKHLARDLEQLAAQRARDEVLDEYLDALATEREQGDRRAQVAAVRRAFDRGLMAVRSLDEDRILNVFASVMMSTLRTNCFQGGERPVDTLSFKLDSAAVPELPRPRPYREIWVYSPRVEGIHLRMGPIARGGLRWSDRREDFRTEVLGLMKAQNVKNTMIVPVGAKGGFVPTRLPEGASREVIQEEGIECYKLFINGLLDITDNLDEKEVSPPEDVIRRDGDDPYLVVAADKGTASFSDIANGIALERGFWMGDAFASGGSVGYDHKGMGITAKGAWEGVKRHFRELGRDIQREPFTVVGIGDMSGDVFGNGMLLSKRIRLRAAFNHLHIFIDPSPDEATSFAERKRLFELPRSTWDDYDRTLISPGGGVWSRQEKSIQLSAEIREWLDLEAGEVTPNQLIRALLTSEVDLLWNGGIGTWVKATDESNADVGDHGNNALRVDAGELRCRVVGEGGNLGVTQLGRVEFARGGGRINTDFVDNAAGVDCSDHEVNIKILLDQALRAGELDPERRRELLAAMTDEVEALVLRNNYQQTQALSVMERLSADRVGAKQRFIQVLEQEQLLDRALEGLPDDEALQDRRGRGEGLYRPELAVLLSYSKIRLYQQLLDSDIDRDRFLATELPRYFPGPLQERYAHLMPGHRLRREIIATQVTNSLVNRMGVTFVLRMREDTGVGAAEVARAYTVARELLGARDFWARVEALDNQVEPAQQVEALLVMWRELRQVTRWVANTPGHDLDIEGSLARLRPGFEAVQEAVFEDLDSQERAQLAVTESRFREAGFPAALARRIAVLPLLSTLLDVVETAVTQDLPVEKVARVYRGIGDSLGLRWLRDQVEQLRVEGQWHAQARGNLRDELFAHHRKLVDRVIRSCGVEGDPMACWFGKHPEDVRRVVDMIEDMRSLPRQDYATVSVAVRSLDQLLLATAES